MSNQNESTEALTALGHFKQVFEMLKQKKFGSALLELYLSMKVFYVDHLKGKYIEMGGRRVPRTAIFVIGLIVLYCIIASLFSSEPTASGKDFIAGNAYEKDGVRVYELRKCNYDACGIIENDSDTHFERIRVKLLCYGQTGDVLAEGTADALEMAPHTRAEFTVPCSEDYAYPKLVDVLINPDLAKETAAQAQ